MSQCDIQICAGCSLEIERGRESCLVFELRERAAWLVARERGGAVSMRHPSRIVKREAALAGAHQLGGVKEAQSPAESRIGARRRQISYHFLPPPALSGLPLPFSPATDDQWPSPAHHQQQPAY
jgi:hypothetical protein